MPPLRWLSSNQVSVLVPRRSDFLRTNQTAHLFVVSYGPSFPASLDPSLGSGSSQPRLLLKILSDAGSRVPYGCCAADMARAAEDVSLPLALLNPTYDMVAEAAPLEFSVLFLYLGGLLALLGFGTFLVVRQVLVKRELENAAKELQDRVRSGEASSEEYFELGAIMLRKKFFVVANKYLELAIAKWEGDEQELAQVYNALGFSYFSEEKLKEAVKAYEKAVSLQPAYVTGWNNLGDALERQKEWARALKAYDTALLYDPSNRIAVGRAKDLRQRVERLRY
ncbi:unnamed protein product [Closterium sp. Naga37s-1]|nr:unnamed protein product [Closterium sp. Naga37s-1]